MRNKIPFLLLALLTVSSCREDVPAASCRFFLQEEKPFTKSLLAEERVENLRSGATIGIYENGRLMGARHFPDLSAMRLDLTPGAGYTVYALVNMGDMRAELPSLEQELPQLCYRIPAYTETEASVEVRGIPMAGKADFTVGEGPVAIPVTRLLAKVSARLSCDWNGARIASARIFGMNACLRPFGISAAISEEDILPFQELQQAGSTAFSTLQANFYVPENMQGVIDGIDASQDKAADRTLALASLAPLLTYLETRVETEGKYEGNLTYRTYLGENATNNFDLERNGQYAWTIRYRSERIDDCVSDWKHSLDLSISEAELALQPASKTVYLDEDPPEFYCTALLTRRILFPAGIPSGTTTLPASALEWSSLHPAIAQVGADGRVRLLAEGDATIRAVHTPSWADASPCEAFLQICVSRRNHYELFITGTGGGMPLSIPQGRKLLPGTTQELHAVAILNGITDEDGEGTEVSGSAVWTLLQEGGTCASIETQFDGMNDRVILSALSPGTCTVQVEYGGASASLRLEIVSWDDSWDGPGDEINL